MQPQPLKDGERVVLRETGLVGRVEDVTTSPEPSFTFSHILASRMTIPFARRDLYRPLMSPAEASLVTRQLIETPAIPELRPLPRGYGHDATIRRLDLYLGGTDAQRLAAYATLLDWAIDAEKEGLAAGPWRGLLSWGHDRLLGELAYVHGVTPHEMEAQLMRQRATAVISGDAVAAPLEPAPPTASLDLYPDEGTHDLGTLEVVDGLLVTEDCLSTDADEVDDGGLVPTLNGTWHVRVVVADTVVSPALDAAIARLARHDAQRQAIVAALSELPCSWLVLAHERAASSLLLPPILALQAGVAAPPTTRSFMDRLTGRSRPDDDSAEGLVARVLVESRSAADGISLLTPALRSTDGRLTRLEILGHCHVEGGVLGVFAVGPTRETLRAINFHALNGTEVWPWGIIQRLGGDGPVPLFGARVDRHEVLLLPIG